MGGLFYFHRDALSVWIKRNWRALIALLISGQAAMFIGDPLTATIGPYLGIGVIFCLLSVWTGAIASRTQDFFGRASYHLFISHMPIAAVLVTGLGLTQSMFLFFVTIIVALVLSMGLVPLERSINVMRRRISSAVVKRESYGRAGAQEPIARSSISRVER